MRRWLEAIVVGMVVGMASVVAQGPTALPLGTPAQGKVADAPAEYCLVAKTAGVLTVAVQGTRDLGLQVVDEDGQPIPDGSSDRDLYGNDGTELLSATITEPGTYRVRVRAQGSGGSTFQIVGAFMGFPRSSARATPIVGRLGPSPRRWDVPTRTRSIHRRATTGTGS